MFHELPPGPRPEPQRMALRETTAWGHVMQAPTEEFPAPSGVGPWSLAMREVHETTEPAPSFLPTW